MLQEIREVSSKTEEVVLEERDTVDDTLIINRAQEESPLIEELEIKEELDVLGEDRATVDDLADGLKSYSKQTQNGGNTLFDL